jgi:drug/metabolite transporter (DMT)-like permease
LRRDNAVALGQTTLTAILWGTSFPVISYGIRSGLNPSLFLFLRFCVAAPVMIVAAIALRRRILRTLKTKAIWWLGLLNAAGFLCQYTGQAYTDASVAALLVNLSVLVTALGSAIILKEKFGLTKTAGVVLALAGVGLLATKGDLSLVTQGQLTGDALYLLAALSWGWYLIYNKQSSDREKWDPLSASASVVILTAVFVSPVLLTIGPVLTLSSVSWEVIAYTAIFNTAFPYVLYQSGLRFLSATSSAIVLLLDVVTAVAISVAFLGETFNGFSLVGALCIMASFVLVSGIELRGKNLSVMQTNAEAERVW